MVRHDLQKMGMREVALPRAFSDDTFIGQINLFTTELNDLKLSSMYCFIG